jgi:hypothetical protein
VDTRNLAKGFLEYASVDLEAAVILLKSGDMKFNRIIIGLAQQAVEKTMKASLMIILAEPLLFYGEVGDEIVIPDQYVKVKEHLKKISRKYVKPKQLGHSIINQLKDDLEKLKSYSLKRQFQDYIHYINQNILIPEFLRLKKEIVSQLQSDFSLPAEEAEKIYDSIIDFFRKQPAFSKSKIQEVSNKLTLKTPCIRDVSKMFEDWSKWEEGLLITQRQNLMVEVIHTVRSVVDYSGLSTTIVMNMDRFLKDTVVPMLKVLFLGLPLHTCLQNYQQMARYPDAGEIPKEDLYNVEQAITLAKNLYENARMCFEKTIVKNATPQD